MLRRFYILGLINSRFRIEPRPPSQGSAVMTRIFLFSIILGFFLGYSVRGHAAGIGTSLSSKPDLSSSSTNSSTGYRVSAVATDGPSSLADHTAKSLDTHGTFREILATLNRESPTWNFSAGAGFFASDLSGTNSAPASTTGFTLSNYSRSVQGEVARVGANYRLTDHLEAGLTAEMLFGSHVDLSSNGFATESTKVWLGGGELLYGFGLAGFRVKAGARYFASLGLTDRSLTGVQGVFEASTPIF
jgi:hypothetical protein